MTKVPDKIQANFIKAAIWLGPFDIAEKLLAEYPALGISSIHTAAILGNYESVTSFLQLNPESANSTAEPYGGTALVYLSLSKYLVLKKRPEESFLKAARVLLDAGADPNAGFWDTGEYPDFETALYGAAGFAHHAALTKLLLAYGANPNDNEAVYHSPETYDNDAMKLLVETGKLTPENLVMMLIRKHDFHDQDGAKFLLNYGADPNIAWRPGVYPIHHALSRGNHLDMFKMLLDHGADAHVLDKDHRTAVAHAAREGRGDVLKLFRERKIASNLQGIDKLVAACAEDNTKEIDAIVNDEPGLIEQLKEMSGTLLTRFAANGNAAGIKQLLDAGLDVNSPFKEGDSYYGTPKNSLPIHVAAWKGYTDVVKLMVEHNAVFDQPDANGDTPLMLAVRACVDSYWMYRRSPDSVKVLLEAGASAEKISIPTGYAEIDELLKK